MVLTRETKDTLWTLIVAPTVWAMHFLVCYITAALSCAGSTAPFGRIDGARVFIGVATLVALGLIGTTGLRAWREWSASGINPPHDRSTDAHRERLLEFATVLLAGLSAVAVLFVALPAFVYVDCR